MTPRCRPTFVGEWGVKQIIAHVGGWQRLNGEMMERMARGEKPIPDGEDYSDDDAMNARLRGGRGGGLGGRRGAALRESFERFIAAAEALPEERFDEGRFAAQMVAGNGVSHVRGARGGDHGVSLELGIRARDGFEKAARPGSARLHQLTQDERS